MIYLSDNVGNITYRYVPIFFFDWGTQKKSRVRDHMLADGLLLFAHNKHILYLKNFEDPVLHKKISSFQTDVCSYVSNNKYWCVNVEETWKKKNRERQTEEARKRREKESKRKRKIQINKKKPIHRHYLCFWQQIWFLNDFPFIVSFGDTADKGTSHETRILVQNTWVNKFLQYFSIF